LFSILVRCRRQPQQIVARDGWRRRGWQLRCQIFFRILFVNPIGVHAAREQSVMVVNSSKGAGNFNIAWGIRLKFFIFWKYSNVASKKIIENFSKNGTCPLLLKVCFAIVV
jgi:hypothetical protein